MILRLYAVFDGASQSWSPPFCAVNNEDASRQFYISAQHNQLMVNYPDDFDLHYIGEYDTDRGVVSSYNGAASRVCHGAKDASRQAPPSP